MNWFGNHNAIILWALREGMGAAAALPLAPAEAQQAEGGEEKKANEEYQHQGLVGLDHRAHLHPMFSNTLQRTLSPRMQTAPIESTKLLLRSRQPHRTPSSMKTTVSCMLGGGANLQCVAGTPTRMRIWQESLHKVANKIRRVSI